MPTTSTGGSGQPNAHLASLMPKTPQNSQNGYLPLASQAPRRNKLRIRRLYSRPFLSRVISLVSFNAIKASINCIACYLILASIKKNFVPFYSFDHK
jgi:hypothetical protein